MRGTIGACRVVLHRTVGQEADERHDELSSVGNSCHEREFARRPGAGQQLNIALPAATGKALDIVGNSGEGEALKAWRWLVLEFDQRAKEQLV